MIEKEYSLALPSHVFYSTTFAKENQIALIDTKKSLRVVDLVSHKTIFAISVPDIKAEHVGTNSKMIAVSENKALVAITEVDKKIVNVYDVVKRKLSFVVSWHRGLPEVVAFDPLNRYLATGGQDGKLCLWFFATGALAYTATSHQDFLSCIVFDERGKFLASSSYDKNIMVMNIYTMTTICSFKGKHGAVIKNMFFVPNTSLLISADRSGKVALWDYEKKEFIEYICTLNSQPTGICIFKNNFILLSSIQGSVVLYNISTREVIDREYIHINNGTQSISYLPSTDNIIIVTGKKGIEYFNPFSEVSKLQGCIEIGDYEEAYSIVRKNPILKYFKDYEKLEGIWKLAWDDAILALEDEDSKKAYDILKVFEKITEKTKAVNMLTNSYQDFQKFKLAIKKRNYQLAYSLLNTYPIYKDSHSYSVMEDDWDTRVKKAIKIVDSNPSDLSANLKILFADFKGINKKLQFIRECRDKQNVLSMFNRYLSEEKYFFCFDIANKHPFLKELKDFQNIHLLEESLLKQARASLKDGHWKQAKNYANNLLVFPNNTKEAKKILEHIDQTAYFYTLYAEKDYPTIIKIAKRYTFLQEIPQYEEVMDTVTSIITLAEGYVAKGNIINIIKLAEPYKKIPELVERFGKILSSSYIHQLYYLAKKYPTAISSILSALNIYVKIFGIDNNLMLYIAHIQEDLKINLINPNEMDQESDELRANHTRWGTMKLPLKIFNTPEEEEEKNKN